MQSRFSSALIGPMTAQMADTMKDVLKASSLDKYPLVRWEITGIAEKRLRESTLLQVVPKDKARLPSSACLSQSFSYHADLLEDDGDGLRTPPGARGGSGQLI